MFTGIINALGEIADIELQDGQGTYRIATGKLDLNGVRPGDSIAVNGMRNRLSYLQVSGDRICKVKADIGEITAGTEGHLEISFT